MMRHSRAFGPVAGLLLLGATHAAAQAPVAVPNPMGAHTVFVLAILAAFLAWSASYSVHTMQERSRKDVRKALEAQREGIFDQMARLEAQKDAGEIEPELFEKRRKHLRGELARVLLKLPASPGPSPAGVRTGGRKRR
jgi:hypothetical protein